MNKCKETRFYHPSVPVSMQSQCLPHSTRHSEPIRHPRSPPELPAQPWNNHNAQTELKRQRTPKLITTSQSPSKQWVNTKNLSARLLTGSPGGGGGGLECSLTGRCPFFKNFNNPFIKKICISIPCFEIFRLQNNRKTIAKTKGYCS